VQQHRQPPGHARGPPYAAQCHVGIAMEVVCFADTVDVGQRAGQIKNVGNRKVEPFGTSRRDDVGGIAARCGPCRFRCRAISPPSASCFRNFRSVALRYVSESLTPVITSAVPHRPSSRATLPKLRGRAFVAFNASVPLPSTAPFDLNYFFWRNIQIPFSRIKTQSQLHISIGV
jgi:hypothetical protein